MNNMKNDIAKKNNMQNIKESVIIISDLHIKETDDAKVTLLINLISSLDVSKVEYFILLGDIFDFCFGDSHYFKKKYKRIGQSLSLLAQKNITVLFFQGNHLLYILNHNNTLLMDLQAQQSHFHYKNNYTP